MAFKHTGNKTPVIPAPASATLDEVMSTKHAAAIHKIWNGPAGNFMKARHGYTHYLLEKPITTTTTTTTKKDDVSPTTKKKGSSTTSRKLVILSHGLGTNLHVYEELCIALRKEGYTTLRYDFFNHGWSVGTADRLVGHSTDLHINADIMTDQVEDLLNFICSTNEIVHGFVGHSTGGVVGILCASSPKLHKRKIHKLALVSPALWATKATAAKVADKVPVAVELTHKLDFLHLVDKSVHDAYLANCEIAFAKDVETNEYRYPEIYHKCYESTKRMFKYHPFVTGGILETNSWFLRGDLLVKWRETFKELSSKSRNKGEEDDSVMTTLIFGTEDVVVDYKSPLLNEMREWDGVTVVPIDKQGHESLYENTEPIAKVVIEVFGS